MNNANRQRLMNLNRELRQLRSVITSIENKRENLGYRQKRRTRANETTLRHVREKLNTVRSRQLSLRREEIALRLKVWQNTHPGQQYNLFAFLNWYKRNQKKYQARTALSLNNLPLNMRLLIAGKLR
jgi:hypothetical protein